jgi:hypothetical protein
MRHRSEAGASLPGFVELAVSRVMHLLVLALEPSARREVADAAMEPLVVVVGDELLRHAPRVVVRERRLRPDAFVLDGVVEALKLAVRLKFVPKGQARGDETQVLQGEPLELPIPRGLAGPGLLADTIVKRWADHTPLHRMERIYARDGLFLSRQKIYGWHLTLSDLLRVLVEATWGVALDSPYLCVDTTGVLVQHAEKCERGHFFVVAAPEKHVLFRFSEKQNNAAVDAMLAAFMGVLVADAHAVYDHLFLGGKVREAGCWAHC